MSRLFGWFLTWQAYRVAEQIIVWGACALILLYAIGVRPE